MFISSYIHAYTLLCSYILMLMYEGFPPFLDKDFERMCTKILSKTIQFPVKMKPTAEIQDFICGLLHRYAHKFDHIYIHIHTQILMHIRI